MKYLMECSRYNFHSQKMSKYQKEEIVVFDDEEVQEQVASQKENCIFVFDDEEQIEKEEEPEPSMSKKEFEDCCNRLEERIMFSNLKNFHKGIAKPTPTFFQDARNKRRESERQQQSQRNLPRPRQDRPSLFSELPKDVRVDFLPMQQKPIRREEIQESLNDELPAASLRSVESEMQGARMGLGEKGSELKVQEQKERSVLKVSNFRQFLYTQLRPGYQVSILLVRTENGLFTTTYKCYFPENGQFVMAIQKGGLGDYVFSSSEVHISQDHISCLGKMETEFLLGKVFRFYDAGEDCSKTKVMENYKKQMAYITYSQDKDHPRRFKTLISTCDNRLTDFTVIDRKAENILQDRWDRDQRENLCQLATREPILDPKDGTYKLDFPEASGVASTKNFIIENENHPEALIFGRQDKDTYLMRIKSPFSILQAVSVALSSIHYKLFL